MISVFAVVTAVALVGRIDAKDQRRVARVSTETSEIETVLRILAY